VNNYLYCGEQYDPQLKFYYNRARYLNPDTGRFWTVDTTEGDQEAPLSLHKYLYAQADPVDMTDPSGNAAYYIERRFTGAKGLLWPLEVGHGYLLFTDASDPGTHDPIMTDQNVIDTFSWHPNIWHYKGTKTPGRIWEDHPFDINPGACHGYMLLTTDSGQQGNLIQCVNNFKAMTGCGYEKGKPKKDDITPDPHNQIGTDAHTAVPSDGVYYSVRGQNCVWWATIMIKQSGIPLQNPTAFDNAISTYNTGGGGGYAGQVISGARTAYTEETMNGIPAIINQLIRSCCGSLDW
jgi:RHS repeat-associated protein